MPRALLTLLLIAYGLSTEAPAQVVLDPGRPWFLPGDARDLEHADLDADGDEDLVVMLRSNVVILWNDGSAGFHHQAILVGESSQTDLAIGDIDGDGDPDILALGEVNDVFTILQLTNQGMGRFVRDPLMLPPGGGGTQRAREIALADMNGDGDQDVVVTTGSDGFHVFENILGVLVGRDVYQYAGASLAIGDLEGDGDPDVVVGSSNATFRIWPNDGTGQLGPWIWFSAASGPSTGPARIALADVDADGDLDLIGQERPSSVGGTAPHTVVRVLHDGNLGFGNAVRYDVGRVPMAVAAADLNGDVLPEIVVTDLFHHRVSAFSNLANGNFGAEVQAGTGLEPAELVLVDVDGDGRRDIVTAERLSYTVTVIRNRSTGPGLPTHPGSNEGIELGTGVNGVPTSGLGNYVKTATTGDTLSLRLRPTTPAFLNTVPAIAGQLFSPGSPPTGPGNFPEVQVDPLHASLLLDGTNGPFGLILLPPTGVSLSVTIPPGLIGNDALFQGFAATPSARNGLFAASDGYVIRFR